ncbi:MAG: preprotein translocase subunit SecG [Verrucomicrobiota bacterium]|nr:preprotein translocase subunit SecG [Limisphaera sp.]MDW8382956.1 preprotein translocase subunit SecG [Verrucomicrobiota bacterium]
MGFFIGLLTFLMVLNCLLLILLVLVQLPKKEAGAGLAFGGAATDALFGAGSGTVLTRITKYAALSFFILAVGLGLLQSAYHRRTTREFQQQLQTQTQTGSAGLPLSGGGLPAATPQGGSSGTNPPPAPALPAVPLAVPNAGAGQTNPAQN